MEQIDYNKRKSEIQDEIVKECIDKIKNMIGPKYLYLSMPTGSGKTLTMSKLSSKLKEIAEFKNVEHFGTVGRANLVDQNNQSQTSNPLFQEHELPFYSWQGLCNNTEKLNESKGGVWFLDEAHLGMSTNDSTSLEKIRKAVKPSLVIIVSATLIGISDSFKNEDKFGVMNKDHHVKLDLMTAFENKMLCNVSFKQVDAGTSLTFEEKKGINEYLKNNNQTYDEFIDFKSERNKKEIDGNDCEDVANKCNGVYDYVAAAHRGRDKIIMHRIKTLFTIYDNDHKNEKAIFFVPRIVYAKYGADLVNSYHHREFRDYAHNIASYICHDLKDKEKIIEDFKTNDDIKVLFVVGMLREGFDFPELELGFDCSYNPENIVNTIQKIGRVMRINTKKPEKLGQYYYAVDPTFYMPKVVNTDIENISDEDTFSDENISGDVVSDEDFKEMASMNALLLTSGCDDICENSPADERMDYKFPEQETVVEHMEYDEENLNLSDNPNKTTIRIGSTNMMVLSEIDGHCVKSEKTFAEVFTKDIDPDLNKAKLLKLAREGAKKPHYKSSLGSALIRYTNQSSGSFDPEFNEKIRDLRPDWFVNTAAVKKETLLRMAKNGYQKPPENSPLYTALHMSYTRSVSNSFDPEFNKEIRKLRPEWFVNTADANKKELLKLASEGAQKPHRETSLGSALKTYTCSSSKIFDAEFNKEIRELRPEWFKNNNNSLENKKLFLQLAKNGDQKPKRGTPRGNALHNYTSPKSDSFDPEFNKEIREICSKNNNGWFEDGRKKDKGK
jgi:superfamily II DNA or RNA helicase